MVFLHLLNLIFLLRNTQIPGSLPHLPPSPLAELYFLWLQSQNNKYKQFFKYGLLSFSKLYAGPGDANCFLVEILLLWTTLSVPQGERAQHTRPPSVCPQGGRAQHTWPPCCGPF